MSRIFKVEYSQKNTEVEKVLRFFIEKVQILRSRTISLQRKS